MENLNRLLERFEKKKLLSRKVFKGLDMDEVLSFREDAAFDSDWISRFDSIEATYKSCVSPSIESVVDRIREKAFKLTFSATEDDDLSAYVSDDFELICMYICTAKADDWIAGMLEMYLTSLTLNFKFGTSGKTYEEVLKCA